MALRVMTYNIRSGRGLDGRLNLDRIAAVIAAESPDLIALQEVDSKRRRTRHQDQAHWLAEQLGYHCAFGAARRWKQGEYGNAILSRFPYTEFRRIALPKPTRLPVESRCLLQCRFVVEGRELEFWNTHLGLLATERRLQMQTLMQKLLESQGASLILCGDFNARIRSREVTGLALHLHRASSPRTFPAFLPVVHLDHVFVTPYWRVVSSHVGRGALAKKASDHLPLVVDLEPTEWSRTIAPS